MTTLFLSFKKKNMKTCHPHFLVNSTRPLFWGEKKGNFDNGFLVEIFYTNAYKEKRYHQKQCMGTSKLFLVRSDIRENVCFGFNFCRKTLWLKRVFLLEINILVLRAQSFCLKIIFSYLQRGQNSAKVPHHANNHWSSFYCIPSLLTSDKFIYIKLPPKRWKVKALRHHSRNK